MKKKEFNNRDLDFEFLWNSSYKNLPENKIEDSWQKFRRVNSLDKPKKSGRNYLRAGFAAAIMLLLFSIYYYGVFYNPTIKINNYGLLDKEVNLPDGSLVLLKEGGEISFKEHFKKTRRVELKGEAFFDVVKDTLKEFNVVTGSTITKVLGTKFSVIERGDKEVEISLYTGKVLVSVKDYAESWALVPGESLVYHKGSAEIRKFNTSLSFAFGNKFIDVNNIKLKELFYFLSKRFDYEFDSSSYNENNRVTLRINKQDSLAEILNILSIINNTIYEIKKENKKVEISRK